jgi:oxygen-independent coproporphyrinogen-3 oxidase
MVKLVTLKQSPCIHSPSESGLDPSIRTLVASTLKVSDLSGSEISTFKNLSPPLLPQPSVAPLPCAMEAAPLAVYIHWPFCRSICPYCHFNRYVVDSVDEDAWAEAFVKELSYWAERVGKRLVVSIFFGGGTPSLMSPHLVGKILKTTADLFTLSEDVEITLELNPTDHEKAQSFAYAGINRISMGVQSFHDETLKFLGRSHRVSDIQVALSNLKSVGLRYSFDLIYGHKNHTDSDQWAKELALACPWIDDHLSLYQLTYEMGTPFYRKRHQELSDEAVLHLESLTERALSPLGLSRYEVSNYARPGAHSVHNRMYWTYQDFLGLGPGAHGRITQRDQQSGAVTKMATHNLGLPDQWMISLEQKGHGMALDRPLTRIQRLQEQFLMGLRLREGLVLDRVLDPGESIHKDLVQRLYGCLTEGLLEPEGTDYGSNHGIPEAREIEVKSQAPGEQCEGSGVQQEQSPCPSSHAHGKISGTQDIAQSLMGKDHKNQKGLYKNEPCEKEAAALLGSGHPRVLQAEVPEVTPHQSHGTLKPATLDPSALGEAPLATHKGVDPDPSALVVHGTDPRVLPLSAPVDPLVNADSQPDLTTPSDLDPSPMQSQRYASLSDIPSRLILTEKGRCVLNSVVDFICRGAMLAEP